MEIEHPKLRISWYWMIIPLVARPLRDHRHVILMPWTWQNVEASNLPSKSLHLFGGLRQITWDSDYDSSQDRSEKQLEILKAHQVLHLNLSDKLLKYQCCAVEVRANWQWPNETGESIISGCTLAVPGINSYRNIWKCLKQFSQINPWLLCIKIIITSRHNLQVKPGFRSESSSTWSIK